LPLDYPAAHPYNAGDPLDFAFVINGVPPPPTLTVPPWIFTPITLNLASRGRWVTAHLKMPSGYSADDVVESSVMLEDSIPVDWVKFDDNDWDRLMIKFDRSDLEDMILGGSVKPAEFKITGRFSDGTPFVGYSEPVKIISGPIEWP
jgi:hypothetical protein